MNSNVDDFPFLNRFIFILFLQFFLVCFKCHRHVATSDFGSRTNLLLMKSNNIFHYPLNRPIILNRSKETSYSATRYKCFPNTRQSDLLFTVTPRFPLKGPLFRKDSRLISLFHLNKRFLRLFGFRYMIYWFLKMGIFLFHDFFSGPLRGKTWILLVHSGERFLQIKHFSERQFPAGKIFCGSCCFFQPPVFRGSIGCFYRPFIIID